MDVSVLYEFTMVGKHGNLSEAAKELHVSQPVLTRHLKSLEEEFGMELFDRTKSPMELTAAGVLLMDKSKIICSEWYKLKQYMDLALKRGVFEIRVSGLLKTSASRILKMARRRLLDENPFGVLKFSRVTGHNSFELVRRGEIDICIEPFSVLSDTHDLESLSLTEERPFVIMDEGHELADRQSVAITDLEGMTFASLRTNQDYAVRKWLQNVHRVHELKDGEPKNLYISSFDSYEGILINGLGEHALVLPESMAKQLEAANYMNCVAIPLDGGDTYDIRAFYKSNARTAVKEFIEYLREERDASN